MGDPSKSKPWSNTQAVTEVHGYKDIQSIHIAALTASQTIAELLTVAVSEDCAGVKIIPEAAAVVNYNPVGAADVTHAALPLGTYVAYGGKSIIDTIELFANAAKTVEIIVFGVQ